MAVLCRAVCLFTGLVALLGGGSASAVWLVTTYFYLCVAPEHTSTINALPSSSFAFNNESTGESQQCAGNASTNGTIHPPPRLPAVRVSVAAPPPLPCSGAVVFGAVAAATIVVVLATALLWLIISHSLLLALRDNAGGKTARTTDDDDTAAKSTRKHLATGDGPSSKGTSSTLSPLGTTKRNPLDTITAPVGNGRHQQYAQATFSDEDDDECNEDTSTVQEDGGHRQYHASCTVGEEKEHTEQDLLRQAALEEHALRHSILRAFLEPSSSSAVATSAEKGASGPIRERAKAAASPSAGFSRCYRNEMVVEEKEARESTASGASGGSSDSCDSDCEGCDVGLETTTTRCRLRRVSWRTESDSKNNSPTVSSSSTSDGDERAHLTEIHTEQSNKAIHKRSAKVVRTSATATAAPTTSHTVAVRRRVREGEGRGDAAAVEGGSCCGSSHANGMTPMPSFMRCVSPTSRMFDHRPAACRGRGFEAGKAARLDNFITASSWKSKKENKKSSSAPTSWRVPPPLVGPSQNTATVTTIAAAKQHDEQQPRRTSTEPEWQKKGIRGVHDDDNSSHCRHHVAWSSPSQYPTTTTMTTRGGGGASSSPDPTHPTTTQHDTNNSIHSTKKSTAPGIGPDHPIDVRDLDLAAAEVAATPTTHRVGNAPIAARLATVFHGLWWRTGQWLVQWLRHGKGHQHDDDDDGYHGDDVTMTTIDMSPGPENASKKNKKVFKRHYTGDGSQKREKKEAMDTQPRVLSGGSLHGRLLALAARHLPTPITRAIIDNELQQWQHHDDGEGQPPLSTSRRRHTKSKRGTAVSSVAEHHRWSYLSSASPFRFNETRYASSPSSSSSLWYLQPHMRLTAGTVLFSDMVGFTGLCERLPVGLLAPLLDVFFANQAVNIIAHGGYIDKYIGDCIMAVWPAEAWHRQDRQRQEGEEDEREDRHGHPSPTSPRTNEDKDASVRLGAVQAALCALALRDSIHLGRFRAKLEQVFAHYHSSQQQQQKQQANTTDVTDRTCAAHTPALVLTPPALHVRVGVHCGELLAGNMGSAHRLSFTVLGDTVNTAARLEAAGKRLGSVVTVSRAVAEYLRVPPSLQPTRIAAATTAIPDRTGDPLSTSNGRGGGGEGKYSSTDDHDVFHDEDDDYPHPCAALTQRAVLASRWLGTVTVAGRQAPVDVFELLGLHPQYFTPEAVVACAEGSWRREWGHTGPSSLPANTVKVDNDTHTTAVPIDKQYTAKEDEENHGEALVIASPRRQGQGHGGGRTVLCGAVDTEMDDTEWGTAAPISIPPAATDHHQGSTAHADVLLRLSEGIGSGGAATQTIPTATGPPLESFLPMTTTMMMPPPSLSGTLQLQQQQEYHAQYRPLAEPSQYPSGLGGGSDGLASGGPPPPRAYSPLAVTQASSHFAATSTATTTTGTDHHDHHHHHYLHGEGNDELTVFSAGTGRGSGGSSHSQQHTASHQHHHAPPLPSCAPTPLSMHLLGVPLSMPASSRPTPHHTPSPRDGPSPTHTAASRNNSFFLLPMLPFSFAAASPSPVQFEELGVWGGAGAGAGGGASSNATSLHSTVLHSYSHGRASSVDPSFNPFLLFHSQNINNDSGSLAGHAGCLGDISDMVTPTAATAITATTAMRGFNNRQFRATTTSPSPAAAPTGTTTTTIIDIISGKEKEKETERVTGGGGGSTSVPAAEYVAFAGGLSTTSLPLPPSSWGWRRRSSVASSTHNNTTNNNFRPRGNSGASGCGGGASRTGHVLSGGGELLLISPTPSSSCSRSPPAGTGTLWLVPPPPGAPAPSTIKGGTEVAEAFTSKEVDLANTDVSRPIVLDDDAAALVKAAARRLANRACWCTPSQLQLAAAFTAAVCAVADSPCAAAAHAALDAYDTLVEQTQSAKGEREDSGGRGAGVVSATACPWRPSHFSNANPAAVNATTSTPILCRLQDPASLVVRALLPPLRVLTPTTQDDHHEGFPTFAGATIPAPHDAASPSCGSGGNIMKTKHVPLTISAARRSLGEDCGDVCGVGVQG